MLRGIVLVCGMWCVASLAFGIDEFDRHSSTVLRQVVAAGQPTAEFSKKDAAQLKSLGAGILSPCIVMRTNGGHWTKALLSWGLRKGTDKPTPVLVIERFVTYDNERGDQTVAAGRNVVLFPGFRFSFDIGQVVPEEHTPDIEFGADGKLRSQGQAKLYALNGSAVPAPDAAATHDPLSHDGIEPMDFAGSWRLNADGRWQGRWDLVVDPEGRITGRYVSGDTQSEYKLKGRISGSPHRLLLEVELANATQEYECYLWTTDKSAMAGTTTMVDRTFGFYAVREAKVEAKNGKTEGEAKEAAGEKSEGK